MSQPPSNFDPTATLLPRVDAPISVQTGGGYYDTNGSETGMEISKPEKSGLVQIGGEYSNEEKEVLQKYSIGPKLQAQIGESTLREFIKQIQTPKCSAGAGAGILLHKDCWAVQAVITHLLRASLPGVVRKSNINPDIRYQPIPTSDQIDLSMEGFGELFSKSAEDKGVTSQETPVFRKKKDLYQRIDKLPFMGLQIVLRQELKPEEDMAKLSEIEKKVGDVQQFKKEYDAMKKKVDYGLDLLGKLTVSLEEKRKTYSQSSIPTQLNDYVKSHTSNKLALESFQQYFQENKIDSFNAIENFNADSAGIEKIILDLETEKKAVDPSLFQKISQKIRPSEEVSKKQEEFQTNVLNKEKDIELLNNIKLKGIFPESFINNFIETYKGITPSKSKKETVEIFQTRITHFQFLDSMVGKTEDQIPFKTLYDTTIQSYSTIDNVSKLQGTYEKAIKIENASNGLLHALNQLDDLSNRVNTVVDILEKEKLSLEEKQMGGAINVTKDLLPQIHTITDEANDLKEMIEETLDSAQVFNGDIEDMVLIVKDYNDEIIRINDDLNQVLSILKPSFAIFKKKSDLQTRITGEIKEIIQVTKQGEKLKVFGDEIQEMLSSATEPFFSDEEVSAYSDFINSILVEGKAKDEVKSIQLFYIEIFTRVLTILKFDIQENIVRAQEDVPENSSLFSLLDSFQTTYTGHQMSLQFILHSILHEVPEDQGAIMTSINGIYSSNERALGFISDIVTIKESIAEYVGKIPNEYDKLKRDLPPLSVQIIASTDDIQVMSGLLNVIQSFLPFFEKYASAQTMYDQLQQARMKTIILQRKETFDNTFTQIINELNAIVENTNTISQIRDGMPAIRTLIEEFATQSDAFFKSFTMIQLLDRTNNVEKTQETKLKTLGDQIQELLSTPTESFFSQDEVGAFREIYKKLQVSSPNMIVVDKDVFVNQTIEIFQKVREFLTENISQQIEGLLENVDNTAPVHSYITSIKTRYQEKKDAITAILHQVLGLISQPDLAQLPQITQNITERRNEITTLQTEEIEKLVSLKKDIFQLYNDVNRDIFGEDIKQGVRKLFTDYIRTQEDLPKIRELHNTIRTFVQSYPDFTSIQTQFEGLQNEDLYEQIRMDVESLQELEVEILESLRTVLENQQSVSDVFDDINRKTEFMARFTKFKTTLDTLMPTMGRTTYRNQMKVAPQRTKPFIQKQVAKLSPELQARYTEILEDANLPVEVVDVGERVQRAIEYERIKVAQQDAIQKQIQTLRSIGQKLGIDFAAIDQSLGITAPMPGGTRKKNKKEKKKGTRKQHGGDQLEDKNTILELYKQLQKINQSMKKQDISDDEIRTVLKYVQGSLQTDLPKIEQIQQRVDPKGLQKFKSVFQKKNTSIEEDLVRKTREKAERNQEIDSILDMIQRNQTYFPDKADDVRFIEEKRNIPGNMDPVLYLDYIKKFKSLIRIYIIVGKKIYEFSDQTLTKFNINVGKTDNFRTDINELKCRIYGEGTEEIKNQLENDGIPILYIKLRNIIISNEIQTQLIEEIKTLIKTFNDDITSFWNDYNTSTPIIEKQLLPNLIEAQIQKLPGDINDATSLRGSLFAEFQPIHERDNPMNFENEPLDEYYRRIYGEISEKVYNVYLWENTRNKREEIQERITPIYNKYNNELIINSLQSIINRPEADLQIHIINYNQTYKLKAQTYFDSIHKIINAYNDFQNDNLNYRNEEDYNKMIRINNIVSTYDNNTDNLNDKQPGELFYDLLTEYEMDDTYQNIIDHIERIFVDGIIKIYNYQNELDNNIKRLFMPGFFIQEIEQEYEKQVVNKEYRNYTNDIRRIFRKKITNIKQVLNIIKEILEMYSDVQNYINVLPPMIYNPAQINAIRRRFIKDVWLITRNKIRNLDTTKNLYLPFEEEPKIVALQEILNEIKGEFNRNITEFKNSYPENPQEPPHEEAPAPQVRATKTREEALGILGFQPGEDPTFPQIKSKWRSLIKVKHPNKGGTAEEFKSVNEAFESLKIRMGQAGGKGKHTRRNRKQSVKAPRKATKKHNKRK